VSLVGERESGQRAGGQRTRARHGESLALADRERGISRRQTVSEGYLADRQSAKDISLADSQREIPEQIPAGGRDRYKERGGTPDPAGW
jgi:hypothetical protein